MQARLQRLSALLQRWIGQDPSAQGAGYAAIVAGGPGRPVATTVANEGAAGDTLKIRAQSISDVTTSARNDQVSLRAREVSGIYTGGGSDSVTIVGKVVSGIHTDAAGPAVAPPPPAAEPPPVPVAVEDAPPDQPAEGASGDPATPPVPVAAGNDALSIAARIITDITTGDGNDALALSARIVGGVDAGSGDDAIAIKARLVAEVTGGDGNDAIAVSAEGGLAGIAAAADWFAPAPAPVVAINGEVSAAVDAAAKAYADVDGGAGNDVISVRTGSVLAVSGGTGDDVVNVRGGTIALLYGAQDGNDTINVAEGAQIVLQIAEDVEGYAVSFGENSMTVTMGEGSVTFTGIGAGTVGIRHGTDGMALISQPAARSLNLAV